MASVRIENFTKMMRGQIEVQIEAKRRFLEAYYGSLIESGKIDGYRLYEAEYFDDDMMQTPPGNMFTRL